MIITDDFQVSSLNSGSLTEISTLDSEGGAIASDASSDHYVVKKGLKKKGTKAKATSTKKGNKGPLTKKTRVVSSKNDGNDDDEGEKKKPKKAKAAKPVSKSKGGEAEDLMEVNSESQKPVPKPRPKSKPVSKATKGGADEPAKKKQKKTGY